MKTQNQTVWNTAQGRIFQFNDIYSTESILSYRNLSIFALHWYIIYFLFALFYFILPHVSLFIIIQSLLFSLSGLGAYLVVREILTEKKVLPLLILFIYMVYYPIVCISYTPVSEKSSIFFILLLFYFYLRDNFKLVLLFAVLSIFVREENALAIFVLGVISFFQIKKRKYFLPLALGGLLWFVFVKFNVYAIFKTPLQFHHMTTHYGYLGETFLDKIKNIVFHPSNNILRAEKISLFKDIFGAVLYLPFLSPVFFMPGIPLLAAVMFSKSTYIGSLRWQPWYLSFFMPFVFIALAGTFEKIYQLDKLLIRIFTKYNISLKRNFIYVIKVISVILILFLFLYIYTANAKKTIFNNKQLSDLFRVKRYWNMDTFGVMSAISKEAKVACSFKLLPMLSAREYALPLNNLTKEIVDRGAYDVILISEDDWNDNMDRYGYVKESFVYKEIYYTPYLKLFVKQGAPLSSLIDNWKFNLISQIKSASIMHNYIFSDFTDYATVLENANILDSSQLADSLYQNKKIHYAMLTQVDAQPSGPNTMRFVCQKPLERNHDYILAFAAKSKKDSGVVYVKGPADNHNEHTEIQVDNKLRLFMLPFNINSLQENAMVLIESDSPYDITTPVIIKSPLDPSQNIEDRGIFKFNIGENTLSFNPWLTNKDFKAQDDKSYQFLLKDDSIYHNPVIIFMKLFNFTIPEDLFRYLWKDNFRQVSEVKAVRY